jgi:hypothetical protein
LLSWLKMDLSKHMMWAFGLFLPFYLSKVLWFDAV